MKLIDTLPFGNKLKVVTNTSGKDYVLYGFVVDGYFLIPFVPHWNSSSEEFNPLYWDSHYAKSETWISINEINFSDWNFTKEDFELIEAEGKESYKEILKKYHNSF